MQPAFVLLVMEDHNRVTYLRKATIGTADTLFNFSDTISLFKGTILSRKPNFFLGTSFCNKSLQNPGIVKLALWWI